ncbi:MAG: cytochrome c [Chloroflexi bacterium]|nr:cytochrome c [Chloroflexota bacterium]
MKKRILIVMLTGLLLGACGYIGPQNRPMNYGYKNSQGGQFTSNGQQIYFTAVDQNAKSISYTGGPNFRGMMGSYLTCASCHGPQGNGGTHFMQMQVMDAPPIYYDALIKMKQDDSGGTPQPDGYTLSDFRGVVVEGHDTSGKQLDQNMPRWQMNDNDLADLLAFLKTLP